MSILKAGVGVAAIVGVSVVSYILFFQLHYWYEEARPNESRVPLGKYLLAADLSAGTGHLNGAMVNVWVRHQETNDQTPIEISIVCEDAYLLVEGAVVKPNDPSSCRDGAGKTGPSVYLRFTLPTTEPLGITLGLPPIRIRAENGETTILPSASIAFARKSKRAGATFH